MISAPGLLVGSGMDTELRGFLHAEPGARLRKMAHSGALMLRFRGGDRERSSTRRWQLRDSDGFSALWAVTSFSNDVTRILLKFFWSIFCNFDVLFTEHTKKVTNNNKKLNLVQNLRDGTKKLTE